MSRTFKIHKDYYGTDYDMFKKSKITIDSGVTVLVGCNGAGKTTLLDQIKSNLESENIPVFNFDNLHDGGANARSSALFLDDMEGFISRFSSSEGENITINLAGLGSRLIKFMKDGDNGDKIAKLARSLIDAPEPKLTSNERWILLDAIDSGLSIDGIQDFKEYLVKPLFSMIDDPDDLYIVVAANSYELARDENTFDVIECKYVPIESYEGYRTTIMNSRKYKDLRYKK